MRFGLSRDALRALMAPLAPPSLADADDASIDLERFAAAAWSGFHEPSDETAGLVRLAIGEVRSLELLTRDAPVVEWLRESGAAADELAGRLPSALERWRPKLRQGKTRTQLEQAALWRQTLVTRHADEWPMQLDDLGAHAPDALWVRGDPARLAAGDRSMAMVGSRASSGYGEHVAMHAVEGVVRHGFATVSGAAYGIDACVHRATLAVGGVTIAVMAGGLDRFYPQGNEDLLREVERFGVLVAEVPSGETPSRHRFLLRNRLIAALGSATVVVEASERSGSINTAGHAATLGRPLGAVPGSVVTGGSAGCHLLIREYGAHLVQSADEMRELVDGVATAEPTLSPRLGLDETRVLDALSVRAARDEQEIAARSGLAVGDVRSTIGLLGLTGAVVARGSGWVRR